VIDWVIRRAPVASIESLLTEHQSEGSASRLHDDMVNRQDAPVSVTNIAEYVERAVLGEAKAIERLARFCLRPAYTVALAIVRRPADAEDVAQDALSKAFERIETCREPERFVAWLMTIVRNRSKNWLDQRRLRDVLPNNEACDQLAPEQDIDIGLARDRLLEALGHLKCAEREVVLLHDLEGFTHEEISDALGISCVMSRQHLFVARRKLRQVLCHEVNQGGSHE